MTQLHSGIDSKKSGRRDMAYVGILVNRQNRLLVEHLGSPSVSSARALGWSDLAHDGISSSPQTASGFYMVKWLATTLSPQSTTISLMHSVGLHNICTYNMFYIIYLIE